MGPTKCPRTDKPHTASTTRSRPAVARRPRKVVAQVVWDSDRATCAENCPRPATQKGCLTARQDLSRQRVGLASPDNSDTHDSNAGRCPASTHPQGCASARPARQGLRSYKVHIGGIGGGPEPAELQTTQWRLRGRTGDVARRRRWRTRAGGHRGSPQQESWTGGGAARARTRRA
jgi:hypothetical protein